MKYCSNCRIDLPETYTFCKSCGGPLVVSVIPASESVTCPSCGAEVKSGWRFCKQCAYDLQAGPVPHLSPQACRRCGSPVAAGLNFCEMCGTPVDISQSETEALSFSSFDSKKTGTNSRRILYGVGGGLLGLILLIGIIVLAASSSGDQTAASSNANVNRSSANITSTSSNANSSPANKNVNANFGNVNTNVNTSLPVDSNFNFNPNNPPKSSRTGRLTTNSNLRSAPNRTALSVGIHFQNARVVVLDEEAYETEDGYSTWYRIKVVEYGCDSQGILGCPGKNSDSDADEGWVNSKYVVLD